MNQSVYLLVSKCSHTLSRKYPIWIESNDQSLEI